MNRTPIAKILPPTRSTTFVPRPRLFDLITTVMQRRLTCVVAEAGFGKSALLTTWWEAVPCAWYTADHHDQDLGTFGRQLADALRLRVPDLPADVGAPPEGSSGPEEAQVARADALAARLAELLHGCLAGDLALVVDDVHELEPRSPAARLVEALVRHAPPRLHLILAGRADPFFPVARMRGRGQLLELGADRLALTAPETLELAQRRLGDAGAGIAAELHRLAGGWPAAVVLALEALSGDAPEAWPRMLATLQGRDAPVIGYLADEVIARQPKVLRDALGPLALLGDFNADLCAAVGLGGAVPLLEQLGRRGLFVEHRQDGSMALRPLVREYALDHSTLSAQQAKELRSAAAGWLLAHGDGARALRLLSANNDAAALATAIEDEGARLVVAGEVETVLTSCRAVPAALRTPLID